MGILTVSLKSKVIEYPRSALILTNIKKARYAVKIVIHVRTVIVAFLEIL